MTREEVIDAGRFGVLNHGSSSPLYWGFWGIIAIEATVFASLIASYMYLRLVATSWPPAGVKPPGLLLPSINTVLLVVSSFFVYKADTGIRRGDVRWLKLGLSVAIALALAFLTVKVVEYSGVGYRWDSHAYGSIVWTITGFHSAHVLALVLKTIVVLVLAFRGYFDQQRNLGVEVNGLYWHFVVIVWIPLYAVLYYAPRLLD